MAFALADIRLPPRGSSNLLTNRQHAHESNRHSTGFVADL